MRNLINYIALEWKLMFRGLGIWVIISGLVAYFYLTSTESFYDFNFGFKTMHTLMILFPLSIALFFLAMSLARREVATKTQLLFPSLPFRSWEIIASKLLALAIPFAFIQLLPAFFYLISGLNLGFTLVELKNGFYILLAANVVGWFMIVVGYLIGSISPKRSVYFLGLLVFISLIYGVNLTFVRMAPYLEILDFTQLDYFTPLQSTVVYSQIWGFTLESNYWFHRLFYIGSILGLLWVYIHVKAWRRKETRVQSRFYLGLSVISVVILWSAFSYISVWQGRVQAVQHELAFYKAAKPQVDYEKYEGVEASEYQLDVTVEDNHQIAVSAQLLITNHTGAELERFPLTLRHSFDIQAVLINDQKVTAASGDQVDLVWVTPNQSLKAEEVIKVKLVYHGKVDEWRIMQGYKGNLLARYNFVDVDRINLLGMYGWYPMGGIHPLTEYSRDYSGKHYLKDSTFTVRPADFKVTIHTANQLTLYSNGDLAAEKHSGNDHEAVFVAKQASGFSIVGGLLQSVELHNGDRKSQLIAGKQMQTSLMKTDLKILVETTQNLLDEVKAIWGASLRYIPAKNETYMIIEDNNPFDVIANPNKISHRESNQLLRSSLANTNGIKLLPTNITREFTDKRQIYQWMLPYYLEGEPRLDMNVEYVFYDLLIAYSTHRLEAEKTDLYGSLIAKSNPISIKGHINKIYLASSQAQFHTFIRELYRELTKAEANYEVNQQRILDFVKNRADASS